MPEPYSVGHFLILPPSARSYGHLSAIPQQIRETLPSASFAPPFHSATTQRVNCFRFRRTLHGVVDRQDTAGAACCRAGGVLRNPGRRREFGLTVYPAATVTILVVRMTCSEAVSRH